MYSQQKHLVIKAVKNYNIACEILYYNELHKENYILNDRKAILKLIKQMAEICNNNKETIWLREKKIFAIAMEGYSYGAERAQVRTINDNDHIIPLYSYGVGTFDFDLKKVNPMAKMAQDEAEKDVNKYFAK